ncbi:hypothetical protein ABID23_000332 [Bartonella silvatica]|uniref:Uncharacterized protein n=1 Tax=Bartonella silvatica TaxID=357760 RepID=A0ABV2HFS9_9HYPH
MGGNRVEGACRENSERGKCEGVNVEKIVCVWDRVWGSSGKDSGGGIVCGEMLGGEC